MLDFGTGIGEIRRVLGVLATAAAVGAVLATGSMRKPALEHVFAGGLLITIVASWLLGVDQDATARSIRTSVQTMVMMCTAWEMAPTAETVRALLFAYVIAACVTCVPSTNVFHAAMSLRSGERFKAL